MDNDYSDTNMDDMITWVITQGQENVVPLNTTVEGPTYEKYRVTLGLIITYHVKSTFKATTYLAYTFILLPMRKHLKYQFNQIDNTKITYDESTDTLFSSTKGIWGGKGVINYYVTRNISLGLYNKKSQGGEMTKTFISEYFSLVHILSKNLQM